MRILLDESLPRKLASELTGHETQTVQKRGWSGLKNGQLLQVIPLARAISPSAAATSAGSPSSSAASRYAAISSSLFRCSAASQDFVRVLRMTAPKVLLPIATQF